MFDFGASHKKWNTEESLVIRPGKGSFPGSGFREFKKLLQPFWLTRISATETVA